MFYIKIASHINSYYTSPCSKLAFTQISSSMLDLTENKPRCWAEHLRPIGDGELNKEPFSEWWNRHNNELGHLPPELCEQWIYRHWSTTRFAFIPLESLKCDTIEMSTEEVLTRVQRVFARTLNPEHDKNVFQRQLFGKSHPTAQAFANSGTWDYALVVLSTETGFKNADIDDPSIRFVLVEGHQRHKYLNALNHFGEAPKGPHRVLFLSSPVAA